MKEDDNSNISAMQSNQMPLPIKLYDFPYAPNPTKLRIYLAEKELNIPTEIVDIREGCNQHSDFLKLNLAGMLPVMMLDDGSYLTESQAIIEYLEEIFPSPSLLGRGPLMRARVRELERFIDTSILPLLGRIVWHGFLLPEKDRIPALVTSAQKGLPKKLEVLESRLDMGGFAVGGQPSIADCTLMATYRFSTLAKIDLVNGHSKLQAWLDNFSSRSSAQV